MGEIFVRAATLADVPALCRVHRGMDDPWSGAQTCAAWVGRRIESGFFVRACLFGGVLAGHAEWIADDGPDGRTLYLGVLEIDRDFHKRGLGRAMLADGETLARAEGCAAMVTIPDFDTGSDVFYQKCGFRKDRALFSRVLAVAQTDVPPLGFTPAEGAPFSAVKTRFFRIGLTQASSRHMWKVLNRRPSTDERHTPAARLCDGSWMQLSWFDGNDTALGALWTPGGLSPAHVASLLAFARMEGLSAVRFVLDEQSKAALPDGEAEPDGYVVIRCV